MFCHLLSCTVLYSSAPVLTLLCFITMYCTALSCTCVIYFWDTFEIIRAKLYPIQSCTALQFPVYSPVLSCTALKCPLQFYIAMHCNVLSFTVLHCNLQSFTISYCPSLSCISLHWYVRTLHSPILPWTMMYIPILPCTVICSPFLPCTILCSLLCTVF